MGTVTHPAVAGPNDPTKQVSKTVYEQAHTLAGTFPPDTHAIDGATHTASGLTLGNVLKALTATTFGFVQLALSELSGAISDAQHGSRGSGLHADSHTNALDHAQDHHTRHEPAGADAMAADAAAGTASLRSLGTTSVKAAAGDHTTPAATATVAGHVPTPPNDTAKFLRGDAQWAAPTAALPDLVYSKKTLTADLSIPADAVAFASELEVADGVNLDLGDGAEVVFI